MIQLLLLLCMTGCEWEGAEYGEEGGGGGGGWDTGGGSCNSAHENCGPGSCSGEGVNMLPGANCLSCHTGGEAGAWTVGGTVFSDGLGARGASNVTVVVTDSKGTKVEMNSSSVGNFYTSKKLVPPLSAKLLRGGQVVEMARTVNTGACNSCHSCGGSAGGKLYEP